jgi:hypothetical protein
VYADNQGHQSEPQTGKRGVLRAYALIISVEVALFSLLWALHVPWKILSALTVLALIAALIGKQLIGPVEHVQISSPAFEHRIEDRYRTELNQLSNLGFKPLFLYGEAYPLFRLLLIYPAFLFCLVRGICRSLIRSNGAGRVGPRTRCRMVRAPALFPSQLPFEPV